MIEEKEKEKKFSDDFYFNINNKEIESDLKLLDELKKQEKFGYNFKITIKNIFDKWMQSFNQISYKKNNDFKKYVKIDDNLSIINMKNVIKTLMGSTKINIFKTDPSNFEKGLQTINNEDFKKYYDMK